MLSLFILLIIVQTIILQKIEKCILENSVFLLLWGLKMQMKMSLIVLEICFYIALEKFWKNV